MAPPLVRPLIYSFLRYPYGAVTAYSAGPQMVISLTEQARIEPATVGVKVEIKVGPIEVTNLVVLEVAVSNPGDKNLDVKDADDEQFPSR